MTDEDEIHSFLKSEAHPEGEPHEDDAEGSEPKVEPPKVETPKTETSETKTADAEPASTEDAADAIIEEDKKEKKEEKAEKILEEHESDEAADAEASANKILSFASTTGTPISQISVPTLIDATVGQFCADFPKRIKQWNSMIMGIFSKPVRTCLAMGDAISQVGQKAVQRISRLYDKYGVTQASDPAAYSQTPAGKMFSKDLNDLNAGTTAFMNQFGITAPEMKGFTARQMYETMEKLSSLRKGGVELSDGTKFQGLGKYGTTQELGLEDLVMYLKGDHTCGGKYSDVEAVDQTGTVSQVTRSHLNQIRAYTEDYHTANDILTKQIKLYGPEFQSQLKMEQLRQQKEAQAIRDFSMEAYKQEGTVAQQWANELGLLDRNGDFTSAFATNPGIAAGALKAIKEKLDAGTMDGTLNAKDIQEIENLRDICINVSSALKAYGRCENKDKINGPDGRSLSEFSSVIRDYLNDENTLNSFGEHRIDCSGFDPANEKNRDAKVDRYTPDGSKDKLREVQEWTKYTNKRLLAGADEDDFAILNNASALTTMLTNGISHIPMSAWLNEIPGSGLSPLSYAARSSSIDISKIKRDVVDQCTMELENEVRGLMTDPASSWVGPYGRICEWMGLDKYDPVVLANFDASKLMSDPQVVENMLNTMKVNYNELVFDTAVGAYAIVTKRGTMRQALDAGKASEARAARTKVGLPAGSAGIRFYNESVVKAGLNGCLNGLKKSPQLQNMQRQARSKVAALRSVYVQEMATLMMHQSSYGESVKSPFLNMCMQFLEQVSPGVDDPSGVPPELIKSMGGVDYVEVRDPEKKEKYAVKLEPDAGDDAVYDRICDLFDSYVKSDKFRDTARLGEESLLAAEHGKSFTTHPPEYGTGAVSAICTANNLNYFSAARNNKLGFAGKDTRDVRQIYNKAVSLLDDSAGYGVHTADYSPEYSDYLDDCITLGRMTVDGIWSQIEDKLSAGKTDSNILATAAFDQIVWLMGESGDGGWEETTNDTFPNGLSKYVKKLMKTVGFKHFHNYEALGFRREMVEEEEPVYDEDTGLVIGVNKVKRPSGEYSIMNMRRFKGAMDMMYVAAMRETDPIERTRLYKAANIVGTAVYNSMNYRTSHTSRYRKYGSLADCRLEYDRDPDSRVGVPARRHRP